MNLRITGLKIDAHVRKPGSRGGHIIGYRHGEPIYGKQQKQPSTGVASKISNTNNIVLQTKTGVLVDSKRHKEELRAIIPPGSGYLYGDHLLDVTHRFSKAQEDIEDNIGRDWT